MDVSNTLNSAGALTAREDAGLASLEMISLNRSGKKTDRQMHEIAHQFEAMVFRQLLKEMRKTVPESGLLENNGATEMYTDIADDYLAQQMTSTNGIGIEPIIYQELKEKNDKLVQPSEARKKTDFMDLKSNSAQKDNNGFMPLHPHTERFLELHHSPKMMELPQKKNEFMELSKRRRVPTDKIAASPGVPQ